MCGDFVGYVVKKGDVVLFGVEATYGSQAPAIDRIVGEVTAFSPPSYDRKISVGHQLSSTSPSSYKEGHQDYTGGKIDAVFRRGDILEYIIGSASDAAAGDAYDHTVTPSNSPGSLTIVFARHDCGGTLVAREVYLGCVLKSLNIASKKGENVTISIGFDCKEVETDSTATSASYFTDSPILFKGSSLTITPASGGSATSVATITDFSMNFNREISTAKQLNSLLPSHKCAENWNADCSFSFYFIDTDELELFHGGTGSQDAVATEYVIDFTCTNGLSDEDERTIEIRGSSSKLGTWTWGDDGGFATGTVSAILKDMDIVCTDDTANWDA